jgi:hypothetical protein
MQKVAQFLVALLFSILLAGILMHNLQWSSIRAALIALNIGALLWTAILSAST